MLPGGTNDSTTLPKALAAMDRVAPPGQTQCPKGSIIRHKVTVRCAVYRHGHKADRELQNREKQRVACEAALEEFSRKLNKRNLQTLQKCEQANERLLKDFSKVKPFVNLALSENARVKNSESTE